MPDVLPTTSSNRRRCHFLLALWLAFAVSYLFSVLPFGNATTGYLPPLPGPTALMPDAPALAADAAPALSNALTWDGECQVVWATLNDDRNPLDLSPLPAIARLSRLRHAAQRPDGAVPGDPSMGAPHAYRLRAPPSLS